MYFTIHQYLRRAQEAFHVVPHDVDNPRTRDIIARYVNPRFEWRDIADDIADDDVQYLIDVLDRADFIAAKVPDIFDQDVIAHVEREADFQEKLLCGLRHDNNLLVNTALRDTACKSLTHLCLEKLRDRFVDEMLAHPRHATNIAIVYKEATGEDIDARDIPAIIRLMPVSRAYSNAVILRAVQKYLDTKTEKPSKPDRPRRVPDILADLEKVLDGEPAASNAAVVARRALTDAIKGECEDGPARAYWALRDTRTNHLRDGVLASPELAERAERLLDELRDATRAARL